MRLLCESPIEKVQCWTFWTGDVSLLFCVLGEGDGVLFEDVDEDIVEELFHDRVGAAEGRASVSRRREVVRELLNLLDDVAGARVLILELLYEGERLLVRVRMLAHQREDELLFLGEVLFELGLETCIEVVEAREHLAVVRVVDDENLVEQLLRLGHELAVRDVVRRFEVIEHLEDRQVLEGLDVGMHVLRLRRTGRDFIEVSEELLDIEPLLADGDGDGVVTAAAVVEVEVIEEANRVRCALTTSASVISFVIMVIAPFSSLYLCYRVCFSINPI